MGISHPSILHCKENNLIPRPVPRSDARICSVPTLCCPSHIQEHSPPLPSKSYLRVGVEGADWQRVEFSGAGELEKQGGLVSSSPGA